MKTGALVISLDLELYWGIGDHIDYNNYQTYFDNTLLVIPEILALFEEHQIECTWATVGMLWNDNWDEWKQNIPTLLPNYKNISLSNYLLDDKISFMAVDESHFFALDTIRRIQNTKGQEIGTHTYSHYYCNEENRNNMILDTDLKKAVQIASKTQTTVQSIVLPRNQFIQDTLTILKENGIKSVRTNPNAWYWDLKNQNKKKSRIARLVDSYTDLFGVKSYPWQKLKLEDEVLLQPASRFLRPVCKKMPFLNRLRINRIKREMTFAAKENEIYHLWWHPHNFAIESKLALTELKEILDHFQKLDCKYNFQSLNMGNIFEQFTTHNA